MLHKGWYYEPMDGKWYYLDEKTGAMLDGWVPLSGKYYYFTEAPLVPEQTYFQREIMTIIIEGLTARCIRTR